MSPRWPPRIPGLALLALLAVAGCGGSWYEPPGALLGADLAAIPVVHRDLFDVVYSTLTGRDCSVVRLDQGASYCRAVEPPPAPPAYCTRTLGRVDCWAVQPPGFPPAVADGPAALSPAQEADRVRRWPPL